MQMWVTTNFYQYEWKYSEFKKIKSEKKNIRKKKRMA
jgi:hypothetical protein